MCHVTVRRTFTFNKFASSDIGVRSTATSVSVCLPIYLSASVSKQVIAPGLARRYAAPADGSSTRGGSTSVRGRVRSPHMAKLQAASVPLAWADARLGLGQTDGQMDGSRYRLHYNAPAAGNNK